QPDLPRPFLVPLNVTIRGRPLPIAALIGAPLTFAIWIAALATHTAARYGGPIWMLIGAVVFVTVRRSRGAGLLEHVQPAVADLVPEAEGVYQRILVPMKLGPIGEAIVEQAARAGADLIVLGSAPRWRRQSRFFSPTVDYVLRRAPCEVMVVAYPQGVLEEDGSGTLET